jgi:hypothetical protein
MFFTTVHGWIGVGPHGTKPGDDCVILQGGDVPFLLRHESGEHVLVGDCYVHEIMDGELMRAARFQNSNNGFCVEREFVIH